MPELRSIHLGLGAIGLELARAVATLDVARPVGAVDRRADLIGQPLGDLLDCPQLGDAVVWPDLDSCLDALGGAGSADVLVMCAASRLADIAADIFTGVAHGMNVVATAEELVWPWLRSPVLASEIARAAERHQVTVVGTGVNPGFVLDALPLLLSRPCLRVRSVMARRVVDVSLRRPQLQEKVGSGLDVAAFRSLADQGRIGHIGLAESAALLAAGLGWEPSFLDETIEPVIAEAPVGTEYVTIAPGQVRGVHQTACAIASDGRALELVLRMAHGEPDPHDEIVVDGDPPIRMRIEGGVSGDTATVGCAANALRAAVMARPGLLTVKDLPLA